LTQAPVADLIKALRRRTVSPVELAELYGANIEQRAKLKAFITPPDRSAVRQARVAERQLREKEDRPLLGIPIAIKDLFATAGIRTTAGSRILRDWIPNSDASAVRRLRRQGAVIFGKTNLHEFAYGVSNSNLWWGIARNPLDETRIPGGSSGGSAIAVIAGMAAAALGSDTGGSIRIPAALCGCVGLKPTYGAVPVDGAVPLGWSLDHVGPLTRTVDDAGLLFDALTDSQQWGKARGRGKAALKGLRVGLVSASLLKPSEPAILRAAHSAGALLDGAGLRLSRIQIPELDWTVAMQLITLRAEASAVHARWFPARAREYGREVRVRLQLGALVSGSDYVMAQRMRRRLVEAFRQVFRSVDVLLLPTTPIAAPPIGERTVRWPTGPEPVDGALVRLTQPFNLSGLPALSVPWGAAKGLPIGIQLVAPWGEEARLLSVGRALESLSR
jgi:aspartyl-tRNA(Asn)/glutamyl-tRNA(Gln) amidotransferase subunit A